MLPLVNEHVVCPKLPQLPWGSGCDRDRACQPGRCRLGSCRQCSIDEECPWDQFCEGNPTRGDFGSCKMKVSLFVLHCKPLAQYAHLSQTRPVSRQHSPFYLGGDTAAASHHDRVQASWRPGGFGNAACMLRLTLKCAGVVALYPCLHQTLAQHEMHFIVVHYGKQWHQ
jgi:hypothetical protein